MEYGIPVTLLWEQVLGLGLIALSDTEGEVTLGGHVIPWAFTAGVLSIAIGGSLYMFAAFHATFMWPRWVPYTNKTLV